jgi:GDPmannose 4,6-dehydratase
MGSLDSRRDWGYAPEYVDAMWRMLQHDTPDDYVLATGTAHDVKEFLAAAFDGVGLDWMDHYEADPRFMRPAEVSRLVGDASHAERELGWKAETNLSGLVREMVNHDIRELRQESGGQRDEAFESSLLQ